MSSNPSSPGRPRDLAKREAILDAARQHFLVEGFDGARVDRIAATAGVAKVTVFNNFGDKLGLLEAMVSREADRMERAGLAPDLPGGDVQGALVGFGNAMMQAIMAEDIQAFDRLLAKGSHDPELLRRFFAAGPARARQALVRVVEAAAKAKVLRIDDPMAATEDLIGLWLGGLWRDEIALGFRPAPDADEIADRVVRGVNAFLTIYGRRPKRLD